MSSGTAFRVVSGYKSVQFVVLNLLQESQWFLVTPYPDDHWSIEVKRENEAILDRLCTMQNHQKQEEKSIASNRVVAKFIAQAWINDNALDIDDGKVEFDCTAQIVEMGREAAMKIHNDQYESDNLVPTEILDGHSGPYRVEVEEAIQNYFIRCEGEN